MICVNYLNLPAFQLPLVDPDRHTFGGHYNFLEYAALHWVRHLESALEHLQTHSKLGNELAEALGCFLELHFTNPKVTSVLLGKHRRKWKVFEPFSFFENLSQAFLSTRKHLTTFEEMKSEETAIDVFDILQKVRQHVESLAAHDSNPETLALLEKFFGRNMFKCSRPSCHFFEMGFISSHTKSLHMEKHLRPFVCTIEGCPTSAIGVATLKDLEVHMRLSHGIGGDNTATLDFPSEEELRKPFHLPEQGSGPFSPIGISESESGSESESANTEAEPARMTSSPKKQQVKTPKAKRQKSEYVCPICSKKFTKRYNMQSHARSHSTQRPHKCDYVEGDNECKKTFVRLSDLTRHRKSHSVGEYHCSGIKPDGTEWGCGRSFSRADTLRNHLASQAGAQCRAIQSETLVDGA